MVDELIELRDELRAVAPLWHPDLNDGIVIVLAPLWRLFAHHRAWSKELRDRWAKLAKGEYDWAQLAMHIWPERVIPKCAEDRSLAIAHDLEDTFWVRDDDNPDKWHPRQHTNHSHRPAHRRPRQPHHPDRKDPPHPMSAIFHAYVANQLAAQVKQRRIVVWYDARSEFAPFIEQLTSEETHGAPVEVDVAGISAHLIVDDGSRYSTRFRVEPLVAGDEPSCTVIYLPGVKRDHHSSVLMELETAGRVWEPQLRQLARNALRQRYTDGVIDEVLNRESTTYADIVNALASEGGQPPSALKSILAGGTGNTQIAMWLARVGVDAEIVAKEAIDELRKLVGSSLGVELEVDDLAKWRRIVTRTALGIEFRSDLGGVPPSELASLPAATADTERNARAVSEVLRTRHGDAYPDLADNAAKELQLTGSSIDALELGAIDTFRFEERALLRRCGELVRDGDYARVLEVHAQRAGSFWLSHDVDRQAQWEAIRLAAELGAAADIVDADLANTPSSISNWIERYAASWHELDRAQRHLEAWIPKLDDDPDEVAINAVRNRYDATLDRLATGFTHALEEANWERQFRAPSNEHVRAGQADPWARRLLPRRRDALRDGRRTSHSTAGPRRSVNPSGAWRAAEHHRHRHGGTHARCITEL